MADNKYENNNSDPAVQEEMTDQQWNELMLLMRGDPRAWTVVIDRRYRENGEQPVASTRREAPPGSPWSCRVMLDDLIAGAADVYADYRTTMIECAEAMRFCAENIRTNQAKLQRAATLDTGALTETARAAVQLFRDDTNAAIEGQKEIREKMRQNVQALTAQIDVAFSEKNYPPTLSEAQIAESDKHKIAALREILPNECTLDYIKKIEMFDIAPQEEKIFTSMLHRIVGDVIAGPLATDEAAARMMVVDAMASRPIPLPNWSMHPVNRIDQTASMRPEINNWMMRRVPGRVM